MSNRRFTRVDRRLDSTTDGSREQTLEGRAILAREVRHVAAVDLEKHLRAGMPHLAGDPFRVLSRCQPQCGRGMSRLVRTSRFQPQVAQQGIPDPLGDVVVIERACVARAEYVFAQPRRPCPLALQRFLPKLQKAAGEIGRAFEANLVVETR